MYIQETVHTNDEGIIHLMDDMTSSSIMIDTTDNDSVSYS